MKFQECEVIELSNSSLATYVNTGTGNYNLRTMSISRITIHIMPGMSDCSSLMNVINSGHECSWNYGISNNGTIGLLVEENHRAWSSGSPDNDHRAVNIVVCTPTTDSENRISDGAYQSLLNLCTDICRRNKIDRLSYTGRLEGSNLTMHCMFTTATNCPGPYLKSKYNEIVSTVNERLSTPVVAEETVLSAYDKAKTGSTSNPLTTINKDVMKPYIATLNDNAVGVNYTQLKNADVVGVMLHAGSYYDSIHLVKEQYRNPNLRRQVREANEGGLRYALYADVRARSIDEAKLECRQLYYVISAHPPKLGIWLHLDFVKDKAINDGVLDVYYKNIVNWGLIGYCGLYVNRTELSKISWDKYKDKFYLWLNDHLSSVSDIDQVLTPQMFKL